jgi:hypothetical protein
MKFEELGKNNFFKKYIFKCIENLYKKKFFESFDNQCYKCKSKSDLIIDHHIPIYLGGKYENGNLVALCRKCNNKKRETHPNEFYDTFEIETLKPILNNQQNIFQFNFNWKAWDENRSKYLESIGFEKQHIENILENPEHNEYIPPKDNSLQVKITLNILKDK